MIKLIILIITHIITFILGAVWLQTKQTKYGIKANFICNKCEAIGCQAKWCKEKRK